MSKKRDPTKYTKAIGLRVKKARKKIKLTGVDCAKILDSSSAQLSDWENGRTLFGADQLFFIATKLGVRPAWLLTGEGPMEKEKGESE